MKRFARVFLLVIALCTVATGCATTDFGTPKPDIAPVPGSTTNAETPFVEATPFQQPTVTETEIVPSPTLEATPTAETIEVKRDADGNILPNPPGEWTKLPQGENQRILIGPEGSNIVLELDSRLGMSEFMFNNGENDYFTKDGKTPQNRIYEAVNNSLYYYWCSTQGGGCAYEPLDMKGVDINFWSFKNKEAGGNIRIDNGVTFKIMPLWDKSGGPGKWDKLTNSEKVYRLEGGSEELLYEVSPDGKLIITNAIERIDIYKEWPFRVAYQMHPMLAFLSAGWNLHDEDPKGTAYIISGEYTIKDNPIVAAWINRIGDFQSPALNNYFIDFVSLDASKESDYKGPDLSIFYVK